jgi:hypothetical protein
VTIAIGNRLDGMVTQAFLQRKIALKQLEKELSHNNFYAAITRLDHAILSANIRLQFAATNRLDYLCRYTFADQHSFYSFGSFLR